MKLKKINLKSPPQMFDSHRLLLHISKSITMGASVCLCFLALTTKIPVVLFSTIFLLWAQIRVERKINRAFIFEVQILKRLVSFLEGGIVFHDVSLENLNIDFLFADKNQTYLIEVKSFDGSVSAARRQAGLEVKQFLKLTGLHHRHVKTVIVNPARMNIWPLYQELSKSGSPVYFCPDWQRLLEKNGLLYRTGFEAIKIGGPARTRTSNLRIMSPLLCQLSYGPG